MLQFITRLEKKLKVSTLKAELDKDTPYFNVSIEVTPSALFLIEKYSWFNLHPQSRSLGHQHINRHRAVVLDMSLSKEVLDLVKDEIDKNMDLLQYLREQPENSPILQTESWFIWQIRQILPTVNTIGETVNIENKYPTLWAETVHSFSDVSLSQQVEMLLQLLKWDVKKVENKNYLIDYYGENGAWQCRITVDNLQSICQFASILPIKVPPERHLDMIHYLTRINQDATLAHFSFNTHTGEVACKSAEQVKMSEPLTQKRFAALAKANTQAMDQHIVDLLKISDIEVAADFRGFKEKLIL